jgi:hypothetical protein
MDSLGHRYRLGLALAVAVLAFSGLGVSDCQASSVNLGQAGDFAIFEAGSSAVVLSGTSSDVNGDIGIASNGSYSFTSPATFNPVSGVGPGTLYYDSGATGSSSGVPYNAIAASLTAAVNSALTASSQAAALTTTGSVPGGSINVTRSNQSVTITGSSGVNVIDVTNISLSNGNLTLSGNASQMFIINVSGQFTANGAASVLLAGGLTANHVLFNLIGGGQDVSLTASSSSQFNGTILAALRNINVQHETVNGGLITQDNIQITSGGVVNAAPYLPVGAAAPSPIIPESGTWALAVLALAAVGQGALRRADGAGHRGSAQTSGHRG